MLLRFSKMVCCVAVALLVASVNANALVILDDFNRPDGTDMGPNWNEISSNFAISGNMAIGSGLGSMIYVGATSNSVSIDLFKTNGGASDYAAIVLGFADVSNSLYIKVQSQNGNADFESVGFYYGDNGSYSGAWSETFFSSSLLNPFQSAQLTATLTGDVVSLLIDTNFDGVAEQTISRGSVPLALLGTGIGLGAWNGTGAAVDNFAIAGTGQTSGPIPTPEPGTVLLLGTGLIGIAGYGRKRCRQ